VYSSCCPHLIDSVTDRAGRASYFSYDTVKRLTQVLNPEKSVIQFGYDANGNRTQLIDPNGNITKFAYDLDNRLTNKAYADGKGYAFTYDSDGLVASRTSARGIVTTYNYDADYNLLSILYSDGTAGVTNTFDIFNRLITVNDGAGTNAYSYDADSQLNTSDGPWANDTITYSFNALGLLTNLVAQGGTPTAYSYDSLSRLTSVQVGSSAYAFSYALSNPLVQRLDRPNGSYTTYQYDSLNRLTDIANKESTGQVLMEFSYTYSRVVRSAFENRLRGVIFLIPIGPFGGLNRPIDPSSGGSACSWPIGCAPLLGFEGGRTLRSFSHHRHS
jgi:YD repeat-containing protein